MRMVTVHHVHRSTPSSQTSKLRHTPADWGVMYEPPPGASEATLWAALHARYGLKAKQRAVMSLKLAKLGASGKLHRTAAAPPLYLLRKSPARASASHVPTSTSTARPSTTYSAEEGEEDVQPAREHIQRPSLMGTWPTPPPHALPPARMSRYVSTLFLSPSSLAPVSRDACFGRLGSRRRSLVI